jgi:hypothetical protein
MARRTLSDAIAGEKPSASWLNNLRDIACHDHGGASSETSDGAYFKPTFAPEFELFQLTGDPTLDDDAREYKAQAKPCTLRLCKVDGDGHVTGTGTDFASDKERYYFEADASEETIWFPSGPRNSDKEPKSAPLSKTGDRVWVAIACMDKIALEAAIPKATVISGTASAAVATTDSTFTLTSSSCKVVQEVGATAPADTVTVYNVFGWQIDSGGLVWSMWNQDSNHWEAFQAKCPSGS